MSLPSSELRVPKHTVAVELAVEGRAPRAAELFLANQRPHDPRPEDVHALLEASAPFLPARDADGAFVLQRDAIVWIAVDGGEDEGDVELYDERHVVAVELRGGGRLDGELLYSPPEGRGRVVDHLNGADRFVRLFAAERVYLVGKTHIVRIALKDS